MNVACWSGDEADAAQLGGTAWRAAEHGDRSRARRQQSDGELQQR
jgi:hypothetical protein